MGASDDNEESVKFLPKKDKKDKKDNESIGQKWSKAWKEIKDDGLKEYLKAHNHWDTVKDTLKFFIHFGIVMGALYFSAMFLALLEDPIADPLPPPAPENIRYKNFSGELQKEFNINLNEETIKKLLTKMTTFTEKEESIKEAANNPPKSQSFLFMKWLYFGVITTTSIGYGDISPKTQTGRFFCIFLISIGMCLMMSLLARCGNIISNASMRLYDYINTRFLKDQKFVTKELLSMICICLIFAAYLILGIVYTVMTGTHGHLGSFLDMIYFWIVTFTTVGYGDILFPIEEEVANIIPHTIYRLFGLAILAAIIDALLSYLMELKRLKQEKLHGAFPTYKPDEDAKDTFAIQYANKDFLETEKKDENKEDKIEEE